MRIKLVVIVGPTGSGKTDLAVRLAEQFDAEIVNADSMQLYRGMDIGTAKPSPEICRRVPHHLVGIVSPEVNFTASDFRREAAAVIEDIHQRGRRVIVVGGTGLYIRALLRGLADSPSGDESFRREMNEVAAREGGAELLRRLSLVDPETAATLHPNDRVRIVRALEVYLQTGRPISAFRSDHGFGDDNYDALKIGITVPREELYRRLDDRVESMLERGLLAEVRGLLASGFHRDLKAMRAIGYKEICAFLSGEYDLEEATTLIKRDTRRYAKRQLTWFNRDPEIYWLEYPGSFATICNHVIQFYA